MLLNGVVSSLPEATTQPEAANPEPLMSHEGTLAFIAAAGAALAAERATAMQRAYDQELADIVRVPLINRIAAELEALERKSPSTRRVYAADCKRFKEFCDAAMRLISG